MTSLSREVTLLSKEGKRTEYWRLCLSSGCKRIFNVFGLAQKQAKWPGQIFKYRLILFQDLVFLILSLSVFFAVCRTRRLFIL